MDLDFEEVKDWNCCGATEYHSMHRLPAHALVGRNLALAAQQTNGADTVVAGCSACYLNLTKTDHTMRTSSTVNAQINDALSAGGLSYDPGKLKIRHLLDIIFTDVGLDAVRSKVVKPLKGLRVAPYYGCMIVRPDYDNRFRQPEYPTAMDKLLRVLGATVVDYPLKTHCCGGHMTQISPPVAYELIRRLIAAADEYQADVLVTLCPMCQLNLDAFQGDINGHFKTNYHIPVLYFTQLIGLAFGHQPGKLGIGKEFVDPRPALARIGIELPEADDEDPAEPRRKKDDPRLPMPRMPEDGESQMSHQSKRTTTGTHWRLCLPLRHQYRRPRSTSKMSPSGPDEELGDDGVVISRDYKFMCSSLGQELIERDIDRGRLDPRGRGRLFAPPARADVPRGLQTRRPQSLSL